MKYFDSCLRNSWDLSAVETNRLIVQGRKQHRNTDSPGSCCHGLAPDGNQASHRCLPVPIPPSSAMKERIARVKAGKLMDLDKKCLIGKGKQSQARNSLTTSHMHAGFQLLPGEGITRNRSWGRQSRILLFFLIQVRNSCHKMITVHKKWDYFACLFLICFMFSPYTIIFNIINTFSSHQK